MCGILGYYSLNGPVDKHLFNSMIDTLQHRGPDDRGSYYDPTVNLALGHTRLSILDLSKDGHQPMHYMDRYTIVFNGEIYNYIDLRTELMSMGYSFTTKTDTEIILASFDKWGKNCLTKFNGMWAFSIYDKINQNLFCARDRFGIKPFYYYYSDDKFIFASEIKAIIPALTDGPYANIPRLLDNILYNLFDHTSETMFRDVSQLRPGHYLEINSAFNLSVTQYYDLNKIGPTFRTYNENVTIYKELFYDSIKLRLRADVPVGSCLSGGLDSTSIVCVSAELLKSQEAAAHHTVSSCYDNYDEKKYDEQEYINEVTSYANTISHKVYPTVFDFLNNLDDVIYYQDEPVGGLSHGAQSSVFKAAKSHGLTVMLDGQGADEQLAGYAFFHSFIVREYLTSGRIISALKEMYCFWKLRSRTESYGLKGLFYFMLKNSLSQKNQRILIKSFTSRQEFDWLQIPYDGKIVENSRSTSSFNESLKKSMLYGLVMLLHYEDRNSMASSIEGRTPFLDYRLVEHILSLPADQILKNGITKRILRDAMKGVIPENIRTRTTKLGFAVPVELWIMKNPDLIRKELEPALDSLGLLFNKTELLKWFDSNISNELALKNDFLWRIISAGRWMRLFNVRLQ
jgi:asparagine synthase (glutamine-hydrolysing)